jgi:hypothetical protein
MKRCHSVTISMLLGGAMTAALLVSCSGSVATPTHSPIPAVTPAPPSASASASSRAASGSPNASRSAARSAPASPSATDSVTIGLPHIDASLEDLLPSTIGGVTMEKFSLVLSAYIASSTGGDRALYAPWLVNFGKTPDDVNMAVAADLTQTENFVVHAIKVSGVDDATLSSSFGDVARKAGWPVTSHTNLMSTGKTVLEIIDPAAQAAGTLSAGYVFAKNGVLYTVITDDSSLLLEALIKLP